MSGYDDYQELMAAWASEYMKPIWEGYQKGAGVDRSAHRVFGTIFYGFTEITNTFDSLRLSETLISIAPPRSKKVSADEYFKYVISTYLQEIYILKERLNAYATKLKRLYERAGKKNEVEEYLVPVFGKVKSVLDGVVAVRGSHVHDSRYSDDELDRISSLALISRNNSSFEMAYRKSLKSARMEWGERMGSYNGAIEDLLDWYFSQIINVVAKSGSVEMP